MKNKNVLLAAAILGLCSGSGAFAKTAKECTAEWRADKIGMQARGTTEKAYVEQCKGGAEPTATPSVKPAEGATAAPFAPAGNGHGIKERQRLYGRVACRQGGHASAWHD